MQVTMKITGPIANGIPAQPDNLPGAGQKFIDVEVNFSGTVKDLKESICEALPGDSVQPDDIIMDRINHLQDNDILNDFGFDATYNWSNITISARPSQDAGGKKKKRKTKRKPKKRKIKGKTKKKKRNKKSKTLRRRR